MKAVHEYSVDRATQTAHLGATRPVRMFVSESNTIKVQLDHGQLHFYDQGDQPIDDADVPNDILEALRLNPLRKGNESIEQVLRFCEFCPDGNNAIGSGEYEAHLIRHLKAQAVVSAPAVEPEKSKTKAKRKAA